MPLARGPVIPRLPLLAPLALVLALGCGGRQPGANTPQKYQENARRAYAAALVEFEDRDWQEATSMFDSLKREYTYSRFARLAELRLADIAYEQAKFPEAVTAYRTFSHDHPNDAEVPYARFRVCKSLFEQVGDTILLPPQEERELAPAIDAFGALKSFLTDYPRNEHSPELTYLLAVITGTLARHELYVARFYLTQDNFEASVARCRYMLESYSGSGLDAEAWVLLGETYLKLKRVEQAREAFQQVLTLYPDSAFTRPAKNFLEHAATLERKN